MFHSPVEMMAANIFNPKLNNKMRNCRNLFPIFWQPPFSFYILIVNGKLFE